ncbi:MAG: hypothetical protein IJW16_00810 [Clostridia bacterium]|nr:hypothetical protein [Clostridia bacterium]
MKQKWKDFFAYLPFVLIPVLTVCFSVLLRLAQGEKSEEIIFGIMLGLVLDLLYGIALLIRDKIRSGREKD